MADEGGGHSGPQSAWYDGEINVCGEVFHYRRTAGMVKRFESKFGALPTLAGRLQRFDVSQAEIARVYAEFIWGAQDAPKLPQIEAWVFAGGTWKHSRALEQPILELVVGNDELRRYQEKQLADAEERGEDPTMPAGQNAAA